MNVEIDMKTAVSLIALLLFAGCSSEVDKCVESQVAAWEAKKERDAEMWKQVREQKKSEEKKNGTSDEWEVVGEKDVRRKEEIEAEARVLCMKLAKTR